MNRTKKYKFGISFYDIRAYFFRFIPLFFFPFLGGDRTEVLAVRMPVTESFSSTFQFSIYVKGTT